MITRQDIEERRKARRASAAAAMEEMVRERQATLALRMETALPWLAGLPEAQRLALAEWAWTQELIARADERTRTIRSMAGGEWSMNREM